MDRSYLKEKKRIIVKIGTSTITHAETGNLDLGKMEKLVRIFTDIHNQNKDVIVVSSGAIGAGRKALGMKERPQTLEMKQACAAVGQAKLMMIYQKLFAEYNQNTAQILITKRTMTNEVSKTNAQNTFAKLLEMGVIPIVNENDVVSTDQIQDGNFGDNDTLAAIVAEMVQGDLVVLMTDIDGLYTDDPKKNPNARFISCVEQIDEQLEQMAKGPESSLGTGGMTTKIAAAKTATAANADMVIINGDKVSHLVDVLQGKEVGTLFMA